MELEQMTVRAGGKLNFTVQRADVSAVSATFIMQKDLITIDSTIVYDSEGIAAFVIESPDTDVLGEYKYQINENFATGSPDIYPNFDECDGDCDLPIVVICESLTVSGS